MIITSNIVIKELIVLFPGLEHVAWEENKVCGLALESRVDRTFVAVAAQLCQGQFPHFSANFGCALVVVLGGSVQRLIRKPQVCAEDHLNRVLCYCLFF